MKIVKVNDYFFWIKNPKGVIERNLANRQFYEQDMLFFIRDNYSGGTFIDVGSSIGNHSIYFTKIADEVHSFEPLIESCDMHLRTIELNGIKNNYVYNMALGEKEEDATVKKLEDDNIGNNVVTKDDGQRIKIKTLDSFNFSNVTLMKIDVQGYEFNVLKGAIETIKKYKPGLFIEIETEDRLKEIGDFLSAFGYELYNKVFNYTPTYYFFVPKEGKE